MHRPIASRTFTWIVCLAATVALLGATNRTARAQEPQCDILLPTARRFWDGFMGGAVLRYRLLDGGFLGELVPNLSNGLNIVHRVLVGPTGDLFTDNHLDGVIKRWDGATGAFLGDFAFAGGAGPEDMIFGADGDLYVSGYFSGEVLRYDGVTGAPLPAPGQPGATFASGLAEPRGLLFDAAGNLLVAVAGFGSVRRYDTTTGAYMGDFIAPGSGGLAYPRGTTYGPDGHLYVGDGRGDAVFRYDEVTGAFLGTFIPRDPDAPSQPIGIVAFGPDGLFYVNKFVGHESDFFKRYTGGNGQFVDEFGGPPPGPKGFAYVTFRTDVQVVGFDGPMAALVPEGHVPPLPDNLFHQGRRIRLKMQLLCGGGLLPLRSGGGLLPLRSGDRHPPRVVRLARDGDPVALSLLGEDRIFRPKPEQWRMELDTTNLSPGTYEIAIQMPDLKRYVAAFVVN